MGRLNAPSARSSRRSHRVRARERLRAGTVARGELRERAQPLAIGRRVLDCPRERRQRTPARPAPNVFGIERGAHLVPERARLAWIAVVCRSLAHEIEPLERARARRVEEVAVAADWIGPLQARAALVEHASRVVVEERRRGGRASAGSPPRGRARRRRRSVAFGRARDRAPRRGPARRRDSGRSVWRSSTATTSSRESSPASVRQRSSSVSSFETYSYVRRSSRDASPTGGCVEAVGVAQHPCREHPARLRPDRPPRAARRAPGTGGRAASRLPRRLGRAPGPRGRAAVPRRNRRCGARDPRTASGGSVKSSRREPPSHAKRSIDVSAWPNGRLVDTNLAVDRIWDAERAERCLERSANAVDARAHDADRLGRRPAAKECEQLLADELERTARARALEEADRAVDRHDAVRLVAEERTLQVRERRRGDLAVARRRAPRCAAPRAAADLRRCGGATRTPAVPARTAARRSPRCELRAPRAAPTALRSDLRSRTRRRARRSTRRSRTAAARPLGAGAGRGPRARAGRAPPGRPRRAAQGRPRSPRGRPGLTRVRRSCAAARRRSRRSAPMPRARSVTRAATTRRTRSARCVGESTGRAPGPSYAMRSKTSSNVPIVPPRSAGRRARSSRSTRSTSDRFGTMSTGSRSRASRYRSSRSSTLPAFAGPAIRRSGTAPS